MSLDRMIKLNVIVGRPMISPIKLTDLLLLLLGFSTHSSSFLHISFDDRASIVGFPFCSLFLDVGRSCVAWRADLFLLDSVATEIGLSADKV